MNNGLMDSSVYHNIIFKKFKKHFPEATEEEINDYFKLREKEKIYCEYCKTELKVNQPYPHYNAPSLDHKKPRINGGENAFSNIAICCHQCNICKGTMQAETYVRLLQLLDFDKEAKSQILNELFIGRFANKLARLKKEESQKELWEFV